MDKENKNIADVDETVQHQEDPVTKPADEAEASQPRTYTQEDVDNLIAAQKAKLPVKEEWEAFQAWKNEAKDLDPEEPTKPEVTTDQRLSELEAKLAKAEQEATQLRNLNAVRSSGINEDFAEYVSFEVNKLVDKDKDFETALTEWSEANPQYKQPTTATGMRRGSSPASQMDGVERHFRELNPNLKLT